MKKSIFILAALLAATFANAQITLEHTITVPLDEYHISFPNLDGHESPGFNLIGDIMEFRSRTSGEMSILDLHTYSTTVLPKIANGEIWYIAKNYFTLDNRICFIVWTSNESLSETDNHEHLYLYDQNGVLIQDLGSGRWCNCGLFPLINGQYMFYLGRSHMNGTTDIELYSLPGNGEATDVDEVSAPQRNTRKYLHNDQVLIDSNEQTYNMKGQVVR